MRITLGLLACVALAGCGSTGTLQPSDSRRPLAADCGARVAVFLIADEFLQYRIQAKDRGELTREVQSTIEKKIAKHPSAGYVNVVLGDVGNAALQEKVKELRSSTGQTMANATSRNNGDRLAATQQELPNLLAQAKSSCDAAGYKFTSIRSISMPSINAAEKTETSAAPVQSPAPTVAAASQKSLVALSTDAAESVHPVSVRAPIKPVDNAKAESPRKPKATPAVSAEIARSGAVAAPNSKATSTPTVVEAASLRKADAAAQSRHTSPTPVAARPEVEPKIDRSREIEDMTRLLVASTRVPTASESKEIQQAAVTSLKDPESARFREMRVMPDSFSCAEVNAKNGFGGYVGFQVASLMPIGGKWQLLAISSISMRRCLEILAQMTAKERLNVK